MFADVLILRPESSHDQVLTYLVPEEMSNIEAGFLTAVAVRQHTEKGLILRVYHDRPKINRTLKTLKGLIDRERLLNTPQLELAHWISRYYACSLNKAVHLFLPPPVRHREKKILIPGEHDKSEHLLLEKNQQDILAYVKEKGHVSLESIRRRFGNDSKNALDFLLKAGLLQMRIQFVPQTAAQKKIMASLTENAPAWQVLEKKAPKQASILRALQGGAQPVRELEKEGGAVRAALKAMEKKGWVSLHESVDRRSPFLGRMNTSRPTMLNPDQKEACGKIQASLMNRETKDWLLFGVTGSGKTEVYLQAIETALRLGRQVLYLVPEIALTPQVTSLLSEAFGVGLAILHSGLSAGERYDEWQRIRKGEARVVLGPRSAVFAPFLDLGLIIIDEEHENTFKQSEPEPRYDARRVAQEMARHFRSVIIRGSATPSLSSYAAALKGEREILRLPLRVASRPLPEIRIVDMKKEIKDGYKGIFSRQLLKALDKTLSQGEQAILFMNRRGFHTFVLCRECGESLTCPHCSISLTYHRENNSLLCHYCNYYRPFPKKCPSCGSPFLQYYGTGTERVAKELEAHFPKVAYTRMDTDTTQQKGSHFRILHELEEGKSQVLIGTQMVAKGLDFPAVTLVGIINADILLNMPDYQSAERSYQLLTQVAGRAGRGEKRGEVVIQTYNPGHYVFPAVLAHDYEDFFYQEMNNRKMLNYPPLHYLIRFMVSGSEEKKVLDGVDYLAKMLKIEIRKTCRGVELIGPAPAPLFYLKGRFRYHLLLKGDNLAVLQEIAALVRSRVREYGLEPRFVIDVEPQNLL